MFVIYWPFPLRFTPASTRTWWIKSPLCFYTPLALLLVNLAWWFPEHMGRVSKYTSCPELYLRNVRVTFFAFSISFIYKLCLSMLILMLPTSDLSNIWVNFLGSNRDSNLDLTRGKRVWLLHYKGPVSRKSRDLSGPENPVVKLQSAFLVRPIFCKENQEDCKVG